jgi:uncharacterized protein YrrD
MIAMPEQGMTERRNVPEGDVVVSHGSHVLALDGTDVGKVREVGTDERGKIAFLTVDPGLFRSERLIPAHWISTVGDDHVTLAVNEDTLRRHDQDRE